MEIDAKFWSTVIITFINIIVLYIILKKLLFKPVTEHMEERSKKIQEALDLAEDARKQVSEMKKDYDEKLRLAKEEGDQIMKDYKKRADKEYEEALQSARKEADLIIQNAKQELEVEKEQLISEVKKEMSNLVIVASGKLVKENLDNETNRKLVSDFINDKTMSK